MTKQIEVLGRIETIEITTNAQKIYRGPYRYIGTDFEQEVDVYEHNESGKYVGVSK